MARCGICGGVRPRSDPTGRLTTRPFQNQLGDAGRIDPHRGMAPSAFLDPPRMSRERAPESGTSGEDPIAIAERHGHRNRDGVCGKGRASTVESRLERGRSREVIDRTTRVVHVHPPASHRDRDSQCQLTKQGVPHDRFQQTRKVRCHDAQALEHDRNMGRAVLPPEAGRRDGDDRSCDPARRRLQRHGASERIPGEIDRDLETELANGLSEALNEIRDRRRRPAWQRGRRAETGNIEGDDPTRGFQVWRYRAPGGVRHANPMQKNERWSRPCLAEVPQSVSPQPVMPGGHPPPRVTAVPSSP